MNYQMEIGVSLNLSYFNLIRYTYRHLRVTLEQKLEALYAVLLLEMVK